MSDVSTFGSYLRFGEEPEIDLLNGRLKLRHLIVVVAIAEQGSVVRAAQHLRLAQPAVTRCLRELERILDVELFVRGPRGVSPTFYGEAFLEHARAALAELRRAGERITDLADGRLGTVRVGTLLAGSSRLLPRAIADLKRAYPGVTVVVSEATFDKQVLRLLAGELDLIVGRLTPLDGLGGLRQIRLYSEAMRLVARRDHPVRGRAGLGLKDLLDYPWVLPLAQTALRQEVEQAFGAEDLDLPADVVECTSILTVRALVRETDMIAVLPELVAAADGDLAPLAVPLEGIRRAVGVTVPRERSLTPAARLLLGFLRERASTLEPVADGDQNRFSRARVSVESASARSRMTS
ncbi:LysR substrate-binding domain-containing protein [Streptosporangium sp. NPDC001559]|uniref:LysR substrate-binding domain-containing protein n=1 Tax=Streptosporangium sp. NPDC001559 TaxID=3366187 RepID=UPI0036E0D96F